jgi:hypothetical protein
MSDIGGMVEALIAAGTPPALAAQVVAQAFTAGVHSATFRGIPVDENAEKRRAYDRERKRLSAEIRRNSTESADIPISPLTKNINKKERGRGTRLSAEWVLPPEGREFCKARGWSDAQIDEEFAGFREYWLSKPGSGGVKLDWLLTWQKWVRSSKVKPAGGGGSVLTPDKISLDEAVSQFAKVGDGLGIPRSTIYPKCQLSCLRSTGFCPMAEKSLHHRGIT